MIRDHIFAISSTIVLIVFTVYISLDTFVISKSYDTEADRSNTAMFTELMEETIETENATTSDTEISETSASSESTSDDPVIDQTDNTTVADDFFISLSEYYQYNTKIYVADVTLASAHYLKTAFANDTYGRNITDTTSSIAEGNNAVLAVNGDYYGARQSGYVIRNGIVYRGKGNGSDVLCIFADGSMDIVSDKDFSADDLVSMGVWQAFTFGPSLIENNTVTVDITSEVGQAMASNPRTAIGIIDDNHFLFVVSDGRTSESTGLSLYELATFMQEIGAKTAYNLDGGGSSTMYFNGEVINKPTTNGRIRERAVSDIVYIG